MKPLPHCVVIFVSLHDVAAAEKALRGQDIWCDMIPTPGELSSNCGMALEVLEEELLLIAEAIGDKDIVYKEIHLEIDTGYREIEMPKD